MRRPMVGNLIRVLEMGGWGRLGLLDPRITQLMDVTAVVQGDAYQGCDLRSAGDFSAVSSSRAAATCLLGEHVLYWTPPRAKRDHLRLSKAERTSDSVEDLLVVRSNEHELGEDLCSRCRGGQSKQEYRGKCTARYCTVLEKSPTYTVCAKCAFCRSSLHLYSSSVCFFCWQCRPMGMLQFLDRPAVSLIDLTACRRYFLVRASLTEMQGCPVG